jgi:REP element-mobilizing transposase RayT
MSIQPPTRRRRSIRLRNYDYREPNAYFITVCAYRKNCVFGYVRDYKMHLNTFGQVLDQCWEGIPLHFPGVELHEFQVMPNLLHGILVITSVAWELNVPGGRERPTDSPATAPPAPPMPVRGPLRGSVGAIIGSFKSAVTKAGHFGGTCRCPSPWQRNYHEHIIRSEAELWRIREYIVNNPANWELDRENPERTGRSCLEDEFFGPEPPRTEGRKRDPVPGAMCAVRRSPPFPGQ